MSSGAGGPGILQMPALGRPFSVGMLYDCRSDTLIPGITLWDQKHLEKDIKVQDQQTSDFSVTANDSISSKSNALDIEAGLKLSFMGGLIPVSGSAKYLDDRTSSNYQSRVVAQYKCTTEFKHLTMNHLGRGNVKHVDVFDHGHATHVVTGILYGAHAFFVFDKRLSEEEIKKDVKGELMVIVKALPSIEIEGSVKLSEAEKNKVSDFQVKFYGDFQPTTNPTTFDDAVHLYKDLPKQLGPNQEKAVPVTVWLYPLHHLDKSAAKLVRQISENLVSKTEASIEQFHELVVRCNDLSDSIASKNFPGIRRKLGHFREMVDEYKAFFTKQLIEILPKIRGGWAEEAEFLQVMANKNESPFSYHHLTDWLDKCEEQIRVMGTYINSMQSVKFAANPGDVSAQVMDPKYKFCLCFNIQLTAEDPLRTAMKNYLQQCSEESFKPIPVDISKDSLIDCVEDSMASNASNFIDFHDANSGTKTTTFIVAEDKKLTSQAGAFIHLYRNGKKIDEDFKPPSAPGTPEAVTRSHDELAINWQPPTAGMENITNYQVMYKKSGEDTWSVCKTEDNKPSCTLQNLTPMSVYEVKVISVCEAGTSHPSEMSKLTTRPTSSPDEVKVLQASVLNTGIQWQKPCVIAEKATIKRYDIERAPSGSTEWQQCCFTKGDATSCEVPQDPRISYTYRVIANCGKESSLPKESDPISIEPTNKEINKERVRAASRKIEDACKPFIFQVPLEEVTANEACMVRKKTFGKPAFGVPEKVILIVGATGAGKTTFINGILNYALGVQWEDDFRFRMVEEDASDQASSVTQWITAYTLNHQEGFEIPYSLTVIDTPGFGDTTGIARDKKTAEQLRHFFSTTGNGGIDHIDAVGFVTQASLARLTPTQTFIFDSILSLFGKDIGDNIFLLITFGDGQKPPVLAGVKKANVPYKKYFKFNNSALYASNEVEGKVKRESDDEDDDSDDDEGHFDSMFWQMGTASYKKFLAQLNKIECKSLTLTKNVLNERQQLEATVTGIQREIQTGLNTLEQLKTEVKVLHDHKADIDRNKSFTYTVQEQRTVKIDIPPGEYTTNCIQCNYTCHFPCAIPQDADKSACAAMRWSESRDGICHVCPGKCHWTSHHNLPYRFDIITETKTKTYDELKDRYEKAKGRTLSAEKLIEKVKKDFKLVQINVLSMTEEVRKLINHLKEIALKPNPLSAVEYIDILIESEKAQAKPGWFERVQHLEIVRQQAETLARLADEGFDPWLKYHDELLKEPELKELLGQDFLSRARAKVKKGWKFIQNIIKGQPRPQRYSRSDNLGPLAH